MSARHSLQNARHFSNQLCSATMLSLGEAKFAATSLYIGAAKLAAERILAAAAALAALLSEQVSNAARTAPRRRRRQEFVDYF